MTLPAASATRRLKHRRQIDVQVFDRGNGLWEVDATLTDTKTRDSSPGGELRRAGTPIHEMLLRLVVDERFEIVEAGAETRWMPYDGHCDAYGDTYGRLVGLNLMQGFRDALRERVGGVLGCTHITELAQVLPTAVVQAFAGEVLDTQGVGDTRPFQIGRCHAYRTDGDVVRTHFPRWYRPRSATETADPPRSPE
jgi:hypothetical protein